ncbi:MAG: SDR family oxidoreductase [Candidatus Cloacimonetes bacterium]|nr:SDR family oxidoreductase [Candidatus Cloacimonadota bacterium]MDY0366070.1 SDR family oxidoreductase [Candidatus Syntrophosphaera sp.]
MLWSDKVLTGKRILISGASSGIGRACAVVCSSLGARIVAMGRNEERLAETISLLQGSGHQSLACDIGNSDELQAGFPTLSADGPLAGFIHSAGIEWTSPLKSIDPNAYANMLKVNLIAGVMIAQMLSRPKVYDKNGSSYVYISSIRGMLGEKGNIEYSSSKSAMFGMVRSMSRELASKGIRVNSVSPAMVETEMLKNVFEELPAESVAAIQTRHLLGLVEPVDVANLCAYLISDLGKAITGTNIVIDSGYSLA